VSRRGAGGSVSSPVTESLSVRLAELQRDAAGLAASFHEQYPKLVEVRRQIQAVQRAIDEETRNVVTRAQRSYQAALRHEGLIQSALNEQQRTAQALEGSSAGYAALRRAVAADEQLFTTLDQKLKDVSISTALQATNAGVVDHARPPLEPYQSPLALNFAVGLMLALIAGVGGALVRERFDRSVRRLEDVDGLMGVPAMAAIPAVPSRQMRAASRGAMPAAKAPIVWATPSGRGRSWQPIGSAGEHQSALSDAFAALRAAVLVKREAEGSRSLLVTSTSAGDGKTTVSVNLALSLARLNQRVLLIDADLRHPCVHEALRLGNEAGLASYLAGEIEWRAAVTPGVAPNLDVLTTRRPGSGPGDLLASSAMRRLLQEASALYDFVVVDSPPAMVYMPDARILAGLTDGVLLTVRGGSTAREAVWQAVSQLKNVVGIVVNHFDVSESPYYHAAWTPDPRPFAN
jgi:capsular exopolysaccharide synthesis family protein